MARKRMIDPSFFMDDVVAGVSAHARLLYIGSWTLADDKHFTLPKNPVWIRAQIFPYEPKVDVSKLIDELVGIGKYLPFQNGGKAEYLFIPTMCKHQKINHPSAPKYPPHPEAEKYLRATGVLSESSGSSPSQYNIIQDKLIKLMERWNTVMPWKVQSANTERTKNITKRLKEPMFVEKFDAIMTAVRASNFLSGRKPSPTNPHFKADFDWIIANDSNYVKILEGKYDNKRGQS